MRLPADFSGAFHVRHRLLALVPVLAATRRFPAAFSLPFACSFSFSLVFALAGVGMMLAGTSGCVKHENRPTFNAPGPEVYTQNSRPSLPGVVETSEPPSHQDLRFTEVTAESGVDFVYRVGPHPNPFAAAESLGGGVAVVDWDGDGLLDLAFARGLAPGPSWPGPTSPGSTSSDGRPSAATATSADGSADGSADRSPAPLVLYRNRGGLRFTRVSAPLAGIPGAARYYHGVFAADYDNDGFPDYLVTGWGGPAMLLRNQGDGTFADVTASTPWAGESDRWTTAATWGDFDNDGVLDLFLARFCRVAGPATQGQSFDTARLPPDDSSLYLGLGDGRFADRSEAWGITKGGRTLSALAADIDGDGDVDLFTGNFNAANFLYLNDRHQRFVETGDGMAVAWDGNGNPGHSTGVEAGDWDVDGFVDLWASSSDGEPPALYRNVAPDLFFHATERSGLKTFSKLHSAWGAVAADFDSDQDLDFMIANGTRRASSAKLPEQQRPQMLENGGNGRFLDTVRSTSRFFGEPAQCRGVAIGDLDNDGDLDAVFTAINQAVAIVRNDPPKPRHSLQARLIGVAGTRWPSGVRVRAVTDNCEQELVGRSGHGYLCTHDPRLHIGMADHATLEELRIAWPGRPDVTLKQLPAGEQVTIFDR